MSGGGEARREVDRKDAASPVLPTVRGPVDPTLPISEGVVVLREQDVLGVGGVDGRRRLVL